MYRSLFHGSLGIVKNVEVARLTKMFPKKTKEKIKNFLKYTNCSRIGLGLGSLCLTRLNFTKTNNQQRFLLQRTRDKQDSSCQESRPFPFQSQPIIPPNQNKKSGNLQHNRLPSTLPRLSHQRRWLRKKDTTGRETSRQSQCLRQLTNRKSWAKATTKKSNSWERTTSKGCGNSLSFPKPCNTSITSSNTGKRSTNSWSRSTAGAPIPNQENPSPISANCTENSWTCLKPESKWIAPTPSRSPSTSPKLTPTRVWFKLSIRIYLNNPNKTGKGQTRCRRGSKCRKPGRRLSLRPTSSWGKRKERRKSRRRSKDSSSSGGRRRIWRSTRRFWGKDWTINYRNSQNRSGTPMILEGMEPQRWTWRKYTWAGRCSCRPKGIRILKRWRMMNGLVLPMLTSPSSDCQLTIWLKCLMQWNK